MSDRGLDSNLGATPVSGGKITPEQLEEALVLRRKGGRDLGKIVLSQGHASEVGLAEPLANRLEYFKVTEKGVERPQATPMGPGTWRAAPPSGPMPVGTR